MATNTAQSNLRTFLGKDGPGQGGLTQTATFLMENVSFKRFKRVFATKKGLNVARCGAGSPKDRIDEHEPNFLAQRCGFRAAEVGYILIKDLLRNRY